MTAVERSCSLLVVDSKPTELKVDDLRKQLEKGDVATKVEVMRKIVIATCAGDKFPQLLMTIIRFVMPEPDHQLKKLLLLFWESVDKVDPQTGKLRPEFILACNSLLHDLKHPNEYICGSTLRLFCLLLSFFFFSLDRVRESRQQQQHLITFLNTSHTHTNKQAGSKSQR